MSQPTYTLTGRIAAIGTTETISERMRKRDLIIDTDDGQYSQVIKFEFINDNVTKLDTLNIGQSVTVHFNLRGRKYNEKYFVQLAGWKVENA